jgi:hypothetical protein
MEKCNRLERAQGSALVIELTPVITSNSAQCGLNATQITLQPNLAWDLFPNSLELRTTLTTLSEDNASSDNQ